jgi:hypothetical protein
MNVTISQTMVDALKTLKDVPDTLRKRFDAIAPADGGYALKLDDEDSIALAELVQWHMRTDPATGKPTPQSATFGELIRLIDEAQF